MAVVQISRIQIRRGKINAGTGLPQLASGELAWAVDTQELYIGNGAVSEGSPAVGNTKVLTINDLSSQGNILNIISYIYRPSDVTINTGFDSNNPTIRTIQDRLDDTVSVYAFGAVGDGVTDDTVAIQRAIDQLFLNTANPASAETPEGYSTRKTLLILPGKYLITDTLYVPSYATIVGSGIDKTQLIFDIDSSMSAFTFVNDSSSIGNPSILSSTTYENQPRFINMSNFSVEIVGGQSTGLILDCVRSSVFENIKLTGGWTSGSSATSIGIKLNAFSSIVTSELNNFKNINVESFYNGIVSIGDILNNNFTGGNISNCYKGFVLGDGSDGFSTGQQYGPRETTIEGITFDNIKHHAVYLIRGTKNSTINCKFKNVGNNGAGNTVAVYPQVYWATVGNTSLGDRSDRPDDLAYSHPLSVYVPEVAGHGMYVPNFYNQIDIGYQPVAYPAFRLPIATDQNSAPNGTIVYKIDYFYRSRTHSFSRRGTITISADIDRGKIQLSDEFDAAADTGSVSESDLVKLDFNAKLMDSSDALYTGALGQQISTIKVFYTNNYSADAGTFSYSYSASF